MGFILFCLGFVVLVRSQDATTPATTTTTTTTTTTMSPFASLDMAPVSAELNSLFYSSYSDYMSSEENSKYFPLDKCMEVNRDIQRPHYEGEYKEIMNEVDNFVSTYRGFDQFSLEGGAQLLEEFRELLASVNLTDAEPRITNWNTFFSQRIKKIDLMHVPQAWKNLMFEKMYTDIYTSAEDWSMRVEEEMENVFLFHSAAAALVNAARGKTGKMKDDMNEFASKIARSPSKLQRQELGNLVGFRWKLDMKIKGFSMASLVHLPVCSIMMIDDDSFREMDMESKLSSSSDLLELTTPGGLMAWYLLAQRAMSATSPEKLNAMKHFLTVAPLDQIPLMLQGYTQEEKLRLISSDLNPLRVQVVWDMLKIQDALSRGLTVDTLDVSKSFRTAFYESGYKLDIEQIQELYRLHYIPLHSNWTGMEMFWLNEDVPWSILQYVVDKHMPSGPISSWKMQEAMTINKLAMAFSFKELESFNPTMMKSAMLKKFLSDSMTNGQLYILYDKIREAERLSRFELPAELYPALPSSILSGQQITNMVAIDRVNNPALLKASTRFTPAQKAAFLSSFGSRFWEDANVDLVLQHHPELFKFVSVFDFKKNMVQMRESVLEALEQGYPQGNLHRLPARLKAAWLEETIKVQQNGYIDSALLLDRVDIEEMDTSQYSSNLVKSPQHFLPHLALSGLTCDLISKISPGEIIEVISAYRVTVIGVVPSCIRKCFATAVRRYLMVKAELYRIQVSGEVELLSLLSAAEIRAIGAEIMLTWGGKTLTSITHPKVMMEVLTMISNDAPHIYLHNGVTFEDLELMASVLFKSLRAERQNRVNIGVLNHMRDLFPYLKQEQMVSKMDFRYFIEAVHRNTEDSKALCITSHQRELIRNYIIKAYGEPSTWTNMDLYHLGDFLIVMSKDDLMQVSPKALRSVLPLLVKESVYGELLPEIRGHIDHRPYYEACAAFLNHGEGIEFGEGKLYIDAWAKLASWHMSGASLISSFSPIQPRHLARHRGRRSGPRRSERRRTGTDGESHFRVERQADTGELETTPKIDYRLLHDKVMDILMKRYQTLTADVSDKAVVIITQTQEMLGNGSLHIIGLDPTVGDWTQSVVLQTIGEYKSAKNLTQEQEQGITQLALDAQIRLIQELVKLLNLNSVDLGISVEEIELVNSKETFTEVKAYMATATYDTSTTPLTPTIVPGDIPTTPPAPKETDPNDVFIKDVQVEAEIESLAEQTAREVVLHPLDDLVLTCADIRTAGRSAAMIRGKHIALMSREEVGNCLEVFGNLEILESRQAEIWSAIKNQGLFKNNVITGSDMINLHKLLPEVARVSPQMINLNKTNIDAISVLGQHSELLIEKYIDVNNIVKFNELELASLGRMLCGLGAEGWRKYVDKQIFIKVLVPHILSLNCMADKELRSLLFTYVRPDLRAFNLNLSSVHLTHSASSVMELGWLMGTLPEHHLNKLPASLMSHVSDSAVRIIPELNLVSANLLSHLSPHAASNLYSQQFGQYLEIPKRRAVRSAGGEDPVLRTLMDTYEEKIAEEDIRRAPQDPAPEPESESEPEPRGSADGLACSVVLLFTILVLY